MVESADVLTARVHLPPEGMLGLRGDAVLRLKPGVLEIVADDGIATMSLEAIDDVLPADGSVTLCAHGQRWRLGDGAELSALARELLIRARSLAGVTRALRSLGSARAAPGADHDRFFQPLLNARRRAERAADDAVRLAAFDGAALVRACQATAADLARTRRPALPRARRALEQELLEILAPVLAACEDLRLTAERVRLAEDGVRLARWREWVTAVRRAFAVADAQWPAARDALSRPAPPRRSFFRRLVRMVKGGSP